MSQMETDIVKLIDYYKNRGLENAAIRAEIIKRGYKPWDVDAVLKSRLGKGAFFEATSQKGMGNWQIFWKSIFKPKELFMEINKQPGFFRYLSYSAFLGVIFLILLFIFYQISTKLISQHLGELQSLVFGNNVIFALLIVGYSMAFDSAFLGPSWLLIYATWQKPSFFAHLAEIQRIWAYSWTTVVVFGLLPLLNIAAAAYTFHVQVLAMSIFFSQPYKKMLKVRVLSLAFSLLLAILVAIFK